VNLKWETAWTSFQIGVLAGAIFAGCSDREIDRLERGLVHATVSRRWRVKPTATIGAALAWAGAAEYSQLTGSLEGFPARLQIHPETACRLKL
jgi:hypothetical protein